MTNMSSGSKRSWEGRDSSYREHKKPREDTRDWRDVHLKTSTGHSASNGSSRRGSNGHRRRDSDHSRRSSSRHDGRDRSRRREDQRQDTSPRQYRSRSPRSTGNGSNELEEGEISPRHSPPTASGAAQPSSLAPAPSSEPSMDLQLETPVVTETTFDPEAARKARQAKWEAIRARSSANGTPAPEISILAPRRYFATALRRITSARPCRRRRLQGMILSSLRMMRRNRHSARHKPRILH
ncbi:hypothetical protein ARMGADRAFT_178207 [Armillaria gallica]|uniref:Uncharacterized protein n=1 Tax=Armillaria gallica TaxID=47427 RepID=A0A2H3DA59_ARMGA|nr:hypothetical protein ARMGADRAFT_178207 [Armillaria gallica]